MNNLAETQITGIEEGDYTEHENFIEFFDWILSLKPKDVKDNDISQQALYKIKTKVKSGKILSEKSEC